MVKNGDEGRHGQCAAHIDYNIKVYVQPNHFSPNQYQNFKDFMIMEREMEIILQY